MPRPVVRNLRPFLIIGVLAGLSFGAAYEGSVGQHGFVSGETLTQLTTQSGKPACQRPTGSTYPHEFFYGVDAHAKQGVTLQQVDKILPHNQAALWCVVTTVIYAESRPLYVKVAFETKGATRTYEEDVTQYLMATGLFSSASVLKEREWIPN